MYNSDQNLIIYVGNKNMKNYQNFDFSQLEESQIKYLAHLSFFSKHKEKIINYFGKSKSSVEGKIAFLEQNSMKLGAVLFNRVEEARLMVKHGYYIFPYLAGSIALGSLLIFAKFSPMSSKLYTEFGISWLFGSAVSYGYIYKQRKEYIRVVDNTYDMLTKRIEKFPELKKMSEEEGIVKNFGNSKYNELEEGEIGGEWEEMYDAHPTLMEGTAEEESQENRQRLVERLTG